MTSASGLELQTAGELVFVIPAAIAASLVGIGFYIVKKRDRQRERIARAHQPPSPRSQKEKGD